MLRRNVHDGVTETEESFSLERLSEEIGDVVVGTYERDGDEMILDTFAHVEVPTFDMFHAPKMFWIVGHVGGGAVLSQ